MLDPALGRFDHVVAMDSLIHYHAADAVRAVAGLAAPRRGLARSSPSRRGRRRSPSCTRWAACSRAATARRRSSRSGRRRCGSGWVRSRRCGTGARPQRADRQRLLHLRGPGAGAAMTGLSDAAASGWIALGTALPAVRRRGDAGAAARPPAAAVAVPGLGRHGDRAADRHAQPRDDRRARRPGLAGGADGLAAAGLRALPGAGRLPLRHPPLGPRLAARALYLDGHAAPVRRARDHAVRADRPVGRHAAARRLSARSAPRLAFLLVGAGLHTVQTVGLALATDLAPPRPARASWRCST